MLQQFWHLPTFSIRITIYLQNNFVMTHPFWTSGVFPCGRARKLCQNDACFALQAPEMQNQKGLCYWSCKGLNARSGAPEVLSTHSPPPTPTPPRLHYWSWAQKERESGNITQQKSIANQCWKLPKMGGTFQHCKPNVVSSCGSTLGGICISGNGHG